MKRRIFYDILMVLLSIYVLGALAYEAIAQPTDDVREILRTVDFWICIFFLLDFGIRLLKSENKLAYLKWGWIDLISSIPSLDLLRWGRLARLVRILRFLRGVKSIKVLLTEFRKRKSEGVIMFALFAALLVFLYGSIAILEFEKGGVSSVGDASGAMKWTILNLLNAKTSISGVVSEEALFLTLFLNRFGLVLFAVFNGLFISWLIQENRPLAGSGDED